MSTVNITKIIADMEANLSLLKKELGVADMSPLPVRRVAKTSGNSKGKGGATEPIKTLIESGFFDTAKSDLDALTALKKKALTFTRSGVATPLMRLVRAGALSRDGAGTKDEPWRYKKA